MSSRVVENPPNWILEEAKNLLLCNAITNIQISRMSKFDKLDGECAQKMIHFSGPPLEATTPRLRSCLDFVKGLEL